MEQSSVDLQLEGSLCHSGRREVQSRVRADEPREGESGLLLPRAEFRL